MNPRLLSAWLGMLAVCFSLPARMDGRAKAPSSYAGTASFRCPGATCPGSDRIVGDESDYHAIGAVETGEGAFLNGAKELWLGVGAGHYQVTLDFSQMSGTAACQLNSNCRYLASWGSLITLDSEDAEF